MVGRDADSGNPAGSCAAPMLEAGWPAEGDAATEGPGVDGSTAGVSVPTTSDDARESDGDGDGAFGEAASDGLADACVCGKHGDPCGAVGQCRCCSDLVCAGSRLCWDTLN